MVIRVDTVIIDRAKQQISVGGHFYQFQSANTPKVYQKPDTSVAFESIAHILLNGHTTRKQLFDLIYGHDAEGGPISGYKIFDVHFSNWKHIFAALNVQLRREWKSGTQYLFIRSR